MKIRIISFLAVALTLIFFATRPSKDTELGQKADELTPKSEGQAQAIVNSTLKKTVISSNKPEKTQAKIVETNSVPKNKSQVKTTESLDQISNQLLSSTISLIKRHELEQELILSNDPEVNTKVEQMLNTGVVDLDLKKSERAPGALENIKSGMRIAAGRNLTSAVPNIVSVANHYLSDVDLKVEAIKALGQLDTETSKEFLKNYDTDDEYLKGNLLISRAMLNDNESFKESITALKNEDSELQESALNAIMLTMNPSNQDQLFSHIDTIKPENHMTLAMTLKTLGSPEAITKLEELSNKFGNPFGSVLKDINQ